MRGARPRSGAGLRVVVAGAALALASCHVCAEDEDCDRWFGVEHEQTLRAADYAVAVGPGGALAVAEADDGFPGFHYAPRDAGTDVDLHAVYAGHLAIETCPYIVVGDRGTIRITDDGGDTWRAPTAPATPAALRAVAGYCPFKTGIAVGDAGTVLVARGSAETWQARDGGTERTLRAVALARETAVAVGDGGTVVRSGDSGDTWAAVAVETTADLLSVDVTSSLDGGPAVGMIGAADGTLLATWDGGASWSRIPIHFTEPIRQVGVSQYDAESKPNSLSAAFLADSGVWVWYEVEPRLERLYRLDGSAHAFTQVGARGGGSAMTVLLDSGPFAFKWCMGCD